jgi:hypothetical protein
MDNQPSRFWSPPRLACESMSAKDMDVPVMEANAGMETTSKILACVVAHTPATTPVAIPRRIPSMSSAKSPVPWSDGFEIGCTNDVDFGIGKEEEEEEEEEEVVVGDGRQRRRQW